MPSIISSMNGRFPIGRSVAGMARRVYPQLLSLRINRKSGEPQPIARRSPNAQTRYSDEQIAAALRQAELGTAVAEITRKLGISEATFYVWKKRFGTLGTPEIRELRQLREENARLKQVVANLTLDRHVLQDVLNKKW